MLPPPKITPTESPEAGFAIYLAMGFITLMSIMVANVGERLNNRTLANLRSETGVRVLAQAQDAHFAGLHFLKELSSPKLLPTGASDGAMTAHRSTCLADRVSDMTAFYASPRIVAHGIGARYYMARVSEGADIYSFHIVGCAILSGQRRLAQSKWEYDALLDTLTAVYMARY